MQPVFKDACEHDGPCDCFLGTVKDEQGRPYDVYVYQDNARDKVPDMHVCMRYGVRVDRYLSPGNAEYMVHMVRNERISRMNADGSSSPCEWPLHYRQAVELIEKWLARKPGREGKS